MTDNVSNELIFETLKAMQAHVSRIPKLGRILLNCKH